MKFKAFIKKWVFKNIGYKIVALVFAFVLWLVILNVTDPDISKTITGIPVTIENEDAVLDGTQVYEVVSGQYTSITVTGSRSIIGSLTADDFTATVDFTELSITNAVLITVELTGDMSKYSSKVDVEIKTTSMVISIDEITTVKIPVEVQYTGVIATNMIIDSTSVTPQYVEITAPESILDTITSVVAYVDYADVDGSASIRADANIYDADGKEVDLGSYGSVDYSNVLIDIEASFTKTVTIHMDDPDDDTESGYAFDSLSYSVASVTIKGSAELLETIDTIEIPSSLLDLTDARSNVSVSVALADYLPEGVTIYNDISRVVITANIVETEEETSDDSDETTEEETATDGSDDETSEEDSEDEV